MNRGVNARNASNVGASRKAKARFLVLVSVVVACLLAACGSSGDSRTGSSGDSRTDASGTGAGACKSAWPGVTPPSVDCAKPQLPAKMPTLEELYAGTQKPPPTTGPPPAKGKKIFIISCGQGAPDCAVPSAAGVAAAKVLGWDAKILDGNFNVGGGYTSAIKTAIAAGADAIATQAIPCDNALAAYNRAVSANIPLIGMDSTDCGQVEGGGGPNVFNPQLQYSASATNASQYFFTWGYWTAAFIAQTDPEAKILTLTGNVGFINLVNDGLEQGLKAWCPKCKILEKVIAPTTLNASAFQAKLGASLAKYRDKVTVLYSPFDSFLGIYGGAASVEKAGLRSQVKIYGGVGNTQGMDLLNTGRIDAITEAHAQEWMEWAAMDELNRYFNKMPSVPQGIGIQVVTKDRNNHVNSVGGYQPPIDFVAAYTKLWTGK